MDGALEGMVRLALVQPDLASAAQAGVGVPVHHEQGAFDATDFPQGCHQFVLARIGIELARELARPHGPGGHSGRQEQDVGPVPVDQVHVHLAADQRPQVLRDARAVKHVAEDRARGKDMVGEPARAGVLFALSKAHLRLTQAAMAHRDTSVSQLYRELGIKPVTLYRYVGPQGQLRQQGEKVLA